MFMLLFSDTGVYVVEQEMSQPDLPSATLPSMGIVTPSARSVDCLLLMLWDNPSRKTWPQGDKLGRWEWICFLNLKPLSSHADSCCCSYMLVEFVQELSQDILSHDSLTAEG